jgi:predicted RNase H-like nuclease (RuvC/YqgF family)
MEPKQNYTLQVLQERVNFLSKEVQEIQLELKDDTTIQRTFNSIEKLDTKHNELDQRVDALEKEQPMSKLVHKWVIAAVWTAASAAVLLCAKFLGIM